MSMWSGTWGTGFSSFVRYYIDEYPYIVAYNETNGLVHYDRVWESLNGVEVRGTGTLSTGRKLIALASLGPGMFLSVAPSGAGSIHRLSLDGRASGVAMTAGTLAGATSFASFMQGGKTYTLLYNGTSGAVRTSEATVF
jgi:hypothetical protein